MTHTTAQDNTGLLGTSAVERASELEAVVGRNIDVLYLRHDDYSNRKLVCK
jgi:hypothetical protein